MLTSDPAYRYMHDAKRQAGLQDWKLHKTLKAIRTRLGLSTYAAAELCGLTDALWRAIERPEGGQIPSMSTIRAICKGLKCTSDELLGLL